MRTVMALGLAGVLFLPDIGTAQAPPGGEDTLKEWEVEWGGRTRDPYVGPDGRVWFVGQAGNYIASFDPKSEAFRRYEIEDDTLPHNLIVDAAGESRGYAHVVKEFHAEAWIVPEVEKLLAEGLAYTLGGSEGEPDGDVYYLRHSPDPDTNPIVLLHCPVF